MNIALSLQIQLYRAASEFTWVATPHWSLLCLIFTALCMFLGEIPQNTFHDLLPIPCSKPPKPCWGHPFSSLVDSVSNMLECAHRRHPQVFMTTFLRLHHLNRSKWLGQHIRGTVWVHFKNNPMLSCLNCWKTMNMCTFVMFLHLNLKSESQKR